MSDAELTPMVDDPSVAAALKADLAVAKGAVVEGFDAAAGLAALEASIAAQGAAGAATASTSLLTKVVIGAVVVGGAAVAWVATRPPAEPEVLQGPVAVVQPKSEVLDVVEPAPPQPAAEVPEEDPVEAVEVVEDDVEEVAIQPRKPRVKKAEPQPQQQESMEERLLREAKMVADARRALASDPAHALKLANDAAKDFPQGQLVEEREALKIRALAKLGRDDEARSRAERYLERHPRGPHADSVRRAVGID